MYESLFKELRFQIGEQYELNEFNLKSIGSTFENGLEYENYEYIKNDFVALFGIPLSKNVVLQYNGEILMRVIFEFELCHYTQINSVLGNISNYLIILQVLIKNNRSCQLIVENKSEAY